MKKSGYESCVFVCVCFSTICSHMRMQSYAYAHKQFTICVQLFNSALSIQMFSSTINKHNIKEHKWQHPIKQYTIQYSFKKDIHPSNNQHSNATVFNVAHISTSCIQCNSIQCSNIHSLFLFFFVLLVPKNIVFAFPMSKLSPPNTKEVQASKYKNEGKIQTSTAVSYVSYVCSLLRPND